MSLRTTLATGLLIIFGAAAIATTALSGRNGQDLKRPDLQLPVNIKPADNIAVQLSCERARVTPPNTLNQFHCTLKNNTDKSITAANVIYSTLLEEAGKETKESRVHTLTTYIHLDFYEEEKNIWPGGTTSFITGGIITYENAVIKGVEAYIGYVEFEDKSSMGPNPDGARIISDLRNGAEKYKRWLAREYKQKSIDSAIELLKSDKQLSKLGLQNFTQEEGAKRYRRRLQKEYDNRGRTKLESYLSRIEPVID
jgi:hypothetical protein